MEEIKKMLRAVISGQSAMKAELLQKISKIDIRIDKLERKIDGVEERLTVRIDSVGKTVAYLEDDTPTREEFEALEKRTSKLEQKISHV